jgi:hypothetical protein
MTLKTLKLNAALTTLMLGSAALLTACGGGGDSGPDLCAGSKLEIATAYDVDGRSYAATQTIALVKGTAVNAVPRIVGLPAACNGRSSIAAKVVGSLPDGLSLEATTGRVTGTPTGAARSLRVELTASVQNYSGNVTETHTFFLY